MCVLGRLWRAFLHRTTAAHGGPHFLHCIWLTNHTVFVKCDWITISYLFYCLTTETEKKYLYWISQFSIFSSEITNHISIYITLVDIYMFYNFLECAHFPHLEPSKQKQHVPYGSLCSHGLMDLYKPCWPVPSFLMWTYWNCECHVSQVTVPYQPL